MHFQNIVLNYKRNEICELTYHLNINLATQYDNLHLR